ncbi:MAG: hypothetical protein OXH12_08265, partial [Chloroflexi bacterium]|nr:hypothetical protein [Chloroflexota bacterium]
SWLRRAAQRRKEHHRVYKHLGVRPVLFIMAEKSVYADAIGEYLRNTEEFGFKEHEILVIHTNTAGEITKRDLDMARAAARDIDRAESEIKVIVSVMMLREGWDVRNVTVVLGLRPFTARAEILPEQVIGRGLRLLAEVGPDRTQTLEVLGTRNLLNVLRTQLEAEGVGVATAKTDPPLPVIITPTLERLAYDIAIPITKPSLEHDIRKLSELKVEELEGIYNPEDIVEPFLVKLRLDFATTETEIHRAEVDTRELAPARELLASITNKVVDRAKLPNRFAELYPAVRDFVSTRCFGQPVNLDDEVLRSHLTRPELQEEIANFLASRFTELTIERRAIEFEKIDFRLSQTKPFSWRRNLPPLEATKTVFNYVATYNNFERRFAEFLDSAKDVARFAALGTTEQGKSGTQFRVDYLKPSGAIGFYHPDWLVVQETSVGEVNLIIETKGRVWEETATKDDAIEIWCNRVTNATEQTWRYARINQRDFHVREWDTLARLLKGK